MNRTHAGAVVARAHGLILLAWVALACVPQVSPSPSPAGPTASPRLPTPVPTPFVSAGPTATGAGTEARIVIRLASCSHTCAPEPGTTVYEDGRVIWADEFLRPLEGRLTPAALDRVRAAVEATGALQVDGRYMAQLRPGAEPIPRGATEHRFERNLGDEDVVVNSADAGDFVDEPDLWIVPAEVVELTELATLLRDPVAWLGPGAFSELPRDYVADRYIVMVDTFLFGDPDEYDVDADEVDWPWSEPIESVGDPFDLGSEGPMTRCLAIPAGEARAMVDAEVAAGAPRRDLGQWQAYNDFGWRRGGGSVGVSTIPLLPHQSGSCEEVFTFLGEIPVG